jgi:protein arginine N-methyltransferase 2
MMGWETPLMAEHVALLTPSPGSAVLNIGYGLGIVDRLFQEAGAAHHTIIEAHPQVLAYMREKGVDKLPGVRILEGRWQDFFPDKLGEVLEGTEEGGFDAVFMDTFAEGYEGASLSTAG